MLPEDGFNEIRKTFHMHDAFTSSPVLGTSSPEPVVVYFTFSSLILLLCLSLSPTVEEITEYPVFVETNQISGAGNMLKTLDPILITIIAMSALGVFLGAICGVVLYCACSHGGVSDRNLSALENYNFELVDGVKLKKDKLNVQSSYSEA